MKPGSITQNQELCAYLAGSAFQTVVDNPVTAYRQLVQQYAKDATGQLVNPKIAVQEANAVFRRMPVSAALSGLTPRLIGVGVKRIPKFGILLGLSYVLSDTGEVGFVAATGASILSAPFINPTRMIEKQQRAYFKQTGLQKPVLEILKESAAEKFKPLLRGTTPLMGHSFISATLGLVGQPKLQKYIQRELNSTTSLSKSATGLLASAVVSPIYVGLTNPLSRLEVIMQTSAIKGRSIGLVTAVKEVLQDSKQFGLRGFFRGQGLGIVKAIVSLTTFHEGRIFMTDYFKGQNTL
jgi:hypothetical protein